MTPDSSTFSAVPKGASKIPGSLKGLIFDCDGVLMDSRLANTAYYNQVRVALGLSPLSEGDVEYVHMSTYAQALDYIVPENLRHRMDEAVHSAQQNSGYHNLLQVERGVHDLLDWLKEQGVLLALCTNRVEPLTPFLEHYGLGGYFNPIQSASNSIPKPDPDGLFQIMDKWRLDESQVAFVGDSKMDELASKAAGLPFWAFKNPSLDASMHVSGFPALLDMLKHARS